MWKQLLEDAILGKVCNLLLEEGNSLELEAKGTDLWVYAWPSHEERPDGFSMWVRCVPGNGADYISDYTMSLETILKPVFHFAESMGA
jgi:hypothetical protein